MTKSGAPQFYGALPQQWRNAPSTDKAPLRKPDYTAWWDRPRDAQLTQLVAKALTNNPRLDQALARVAAARALARGEAAQGLPKIDATGSLDLVVRPIGRAKGLNEKGEDEGKGSRRSIGTFENRADALWEIDLFGRARSAVRAAQAGAIAAEEEAGAAKVSLIAETVRTYVELRGAQNRLAVLRRDAEARSELAMMTRRRKEAGIAGAYDLERANASAQAAQARLPEAELAAETALQRLATLAGSPVADPSLARQASIPRLDLPQANLPLDLLRTRPDIRVAEWTVIQRAAELGVAEAEMYPRLTLNGSITLSGNLLGQPLIGNTVQISGGPSLTIPLLDWGQRRAVADARAAQLREALAQYKQAVLTGVEEVEIALASIRQTRERVARLASAAQSAKKALDMSDRLFRSGLIGIEERLNNETDYRAAGLSLAEAMQEASISIVTLYRALGGPQEG